MFEKFGYLVVTLIMLLSYLWLRRRYKLPAMGTQKQLVILFSLAYICGFAWDNFAVSSGHWLYQNMLGLYLGYSPVENILFDVAYVITIVTFYQFLEMRLKKKGKI